MAGRVISFRDFVSLHTNMKLPVKLIHEETVRAFESITFHCTAPQAASVCLIGDFNNWSPTTHPMLRQPDGSWLLQISLPRGRHHYQFLIDGEPVLDPEAMCIVRQERHSKVSLIALS
jgi:1,4-alpha-glucan branching enzyme